MSNVTNARNYPRRPGVKPADPLNEPLTSPADLWMLFGRYMASLILMLMTIVFIIHPDPTRRVFAVPFGCVSLLLQFATIRLWRRLRDERLLAKEARAETLAAQQTSEKKAAKP